MNMKLCDLKSHISYVFLKATCISGLSVKSGFPPSLYFSSDLHQTHICFHLLLLLLGARNLSISWDLWKIFWKPYKSLWKLVRILGLEIIVRNVSSFSEKHNSEKWGNTLTGAMLELPPAGPPDLDLRLTTDWNRPATKTGHSDAREPEDKGRILSVLTRDCRVAGTRGQP
jgi:hypothetical protein